ncbi:hypothetical protein FQR65_LT03561 [Abscondita terminalis]|nr:hypothetical protein FQR65_LT03561 [Abscondita terminalis]
MRQLFILILLPILPISTGKSNVVIIQVINNEEVVVKSLNLMAPIDERVEFHCYVNLTFGNTSYLRSGAHWKTPIYQSSKAPIINGSVLIIPRMSWLDEGDYACLAGRNLHQRFYLSIAVKDWFDTKDLFDTKDIFNKKLEIPNFFPAVIVIILGLVRMCYYFRSRSNASWERLRTANCRHQLCMHRRRADPMATCLLQSTRTSALSIVIVGAPVNENGIENSVSEGDRPPAYNEVIPQDLPPTYNEAIETSSNEVPSSENRT